MSLFWVVRESAGALLDYDGERYPGDGKRYRPGGKVKELDAKRGVQAAGQIDPIDQMLYWDRMGGLPDYGGRVPYRGK